MSQERMVNLAFVAAALLLWFLSAHLFAGLFDAFRPEWDAGIIGREFRLSNLLGISVGILGGLALWRNARVLVLAHEVAGELRKVTWPSMAETRLSTVVVVATTIIVAMCLWFFDLVFSALTKLIYRI
jgi:preprotein translocase subunit SecE